jgi:outer membrane protein OmpA-like peptidoglycan-associated protein
VAVAPPVDEAAEEAAGEALCDWTDIPLTITQQIVFDEGSVDLGIGGGGGVGGGSKSVRVNLPSMDAVLRVCRENPDAKVCIEGHADEGEGGSTEASVNISRRRAEAVQSYMQQQGVPLHRMRVAACGAEDSVGAPPPAVPPAAGGARGRPGRKKAAPRHNRHVRFAVIQEMTIKGTIKFAPCSSEVDRSSYRLLDRVQRVLRRRPGLCLRVEGHTDSSPMWGGNGPLSQQRAQAVVDHLMRELGEGAAEAGADVAAASTPPLQPHQLVAQGFGESRPVQSNATRPGKAANRRCEFHVLHRESAKSLSTLVSSPEKREALTANTELLKDLRRVCSGAAGVAAPVVRRAAASLLLASGAVWHVQRVLLLAAQGHPRQGGGGGMAAARTLAAASSGLARLPAEVIRRIMQYYLTLGCWDGKASA